MATDINWKRVAWLTTFFYVFHTNGPEGWSRIGGLPISGAFWATWFLLVVVCAMKLKASFR